MKGFLNLSYEETGDGRTSCSHDCDIELDSYEAIMLVNDVIKILQLTDNDIRHIGGLMLTGVLPIQCLDEKKTEGSTHVEFNEKAIMHAEKNSRTDNDLSDLLNIR